MWVWGPFNHTLDSFLHKWANKIGSCVEWIRFLFCFVLKKNMNLCRLHKQRIRFHFGGIGPSNPLYVLWNGLISLCCCSWIKLYLHSMSNKWNWNAQLLCFFRVHHISHTIQINGKPLAVQWIVIQQTQKHRIVLYTWLLNDLRNLLCSCVLNVKCNEWTELDQMATANEYAMLWCDITTIVCM